MQRGAYLTVMFCMLAARAMAEDFRALVVADLLETFPSARITNCSSCELRRPAVAGAVKQDAFFEHPSVPGIPARAEYQITLPAIKTNDVLLLAFEIALADGIKAGSGEDGVTFRVQIEGQEVLSAHTKETRWQPRAVDLTSHAGKSIRLDLLTEAGKNTSYDWAVWGSPRVLHFTPSTSARKGGIGVIACLVSGEIADDKLRVKPVGAAEAMDIALTGINGWLVRDYSFPAAQGIELSETPASVKKVLVGNYEPEIRLTRLSPEVAVIESGKMFSLGVEVQNQGRGMLEPGEGRVRGQLQSAPLPVLDLPHIEPGKTWTGRWNVKVPAPGTVTLQTTLETRTYTNARSRVIDVFAPRDSAEGTSIENEFVRITFMKEASGYAYARVFARVNREWIESAVWSPLWSFVSETRKGDAAWTARALSHAHADHSSIEFRQAALDPNGDEWNLRLRVALEKRAPLARITYECSPVSRGKLKKAWGPNLYVGDDTTRAAKTWGLFPGLEYLYGAEPSSNVRDFAPNLADRRSPPPHQVTVPLMALTIGPESQVPVEGSDQFFTPDSLRDARPMAVQFPQMRTNVTIALAWRGSATPRFASPNFDEGMKNHRLALSVENNADEPLKLESTLIVAAGPVLVAMREWLRDNGGLPQPNVWPRSFHEELDVCRAGFLKTLWDASSQKWRHCIGWGASHAPGFASLLWWDARVATNAEARARVDLVAANMLRDGGAGLFCSQANCHIMQWEFPFLYGHLPEALAAAEALARQLINTQRPEGGWVYQPASKEQADLGRAGDSVLGTCANRASTLLRFARITGDAPALEAGEKALHFMERFRVPRGGQTWECPMYEPDILAAAYAVRAYHDGYRCTGNSRWLHNAVYWAETGVPFQYLWSLPEKPMMLGASIPVFGSTFYTHSWLATPVQWCGLVYAYHVWHLADDLERAKPVRSGSPLPLALDFSPKDWRRMVELITSSAVHQQFGAGERIGAYPDSISNFEKRNPAFLNPEDILVNVLALSGHNPDIKTVRAGGRVISSAAKIDKARNSARKLEFELAWFPGEVSHTLIKGPVPAKVLVDGELLARSESPVRREPGWWWDAKNERFFLAISHAQTRVKVEILQAP